QAARWCSTLEPTGRQAPSSGQTSASDLDLSPIGRGPPRGRGESAVAQHRGQSRVALPGARKLMALEGWLFLSILKLYCLPIEPDCTIETIRWSPTGMCGLATNFSRSTLPLAGSTRLHLRFLPFPLQTRCLGTVAVCLAIGQPLPVQDRNTLAPPGTPLTMNWPVIFVNVAVVVEKSHCMVALMRLSWGSLIVAVAVFDDPPAFVALYTKRSVP